MSTQEQILNELKCIRIENRIRELKQELKTSHSHAVTNDIEDDIRKLKDEKISIYDPWWEPARHGR